MVDVKMLYFKALAYYYAAAALINQSDSGDVELLLDLFEKLYNVVPSKGLLTMFSLAPRTEKARRSRTSPSAPARTTTGST